jgi:hypothetical protein
MNLTFHLEINMTLPLTLAPNTPGRPAAPPVAACRFCVIGLPIGDRPCPNGCPSP